MPLTVTARPGRGGLTLVALAADRVLPLSPDGLVEYLLAAGRPRVTVAVADLRGLPALAWAGRVGLADLLVRVAPRRVVPFADLAEAYEAYYTRLPRRHPLWRLKRLTPYGHWPVLERIAVELLHPAAATDRDVERMAASADYAAGWGYPDFVRVAAARPGGHYARLYRGGLGRAAVTVAYLLDVLAVWSGGAPAGLSGAAADLWSRGATP